MAKLREIEEKVVAAIYAQEPHQRFLSRQALCQKYCISRSSADRLVAELVRKGFLYSRKGSGTFVSPHLPEITNVTKNQSVRSVGIIMPDVRYDQYPEMYRGVEEYLRQKNVDLMVCYTDDDPSREYAFIRRLIAAGVDGIIIVPSASPSMENYACLEEMKIPFVFWNRSMDAMPNVPQVCLNGYHGGSIATRHLLEMGYQRIAYLAPKRFRSSMDRFYGYDSALSDYGIESDPHLVRLFMEDDTPEIVYALTQELLQGPKAPDAFLCFVDMMAPAVCRAIHDCGLRVSEDVGVIGFESSISWTDAHMNMALTYVDINSNHSGYLVARTLYRMIVKNEDIHQPRMLVNRPTLIIRETCKGKKRG